MVLITRGMNTAESYTLGDLIKITGAKSRQLQRWADEGVIQADRVTDKAGTGVHRRFSRREAIIACVIHPFAERQIMMPELVAISQQLRASLTFAGKFFEAAIVGDGETIFAYEGYKRKLTETDPDVPEWLSQFFLGSRSDFVSRSTSWPDVVMAIRLETYLSGLR